MVQVVQAGDRRTSVDDIFDFLYEQISDLQLRPGDKISEADIAARFGVSRQPVRDAFSRLANLDLLLIRPQRATEVKRFSMREISKSRFVRASVEKEVLRRAAERCDRINAAQLDEALMQQEAVVEAGDYDAFGALDYDFHKTLCAIAQTEFAFDVIKAEKSKVDRLCVLGMAKESRMPELLADHRIIADAVKAQKPEEAVAAGVLHLSRLDETIDRISTNNANYFEPEDR
ncbi:GntR family transcriptional regulator [Algicella marina]|uniref:FCD domain-containing protein n=1 Tax=Algicella marina TaxID=2683284 RepID=A0A6P1T0X4_9RHOB|nr:GntR family transcriptional regulator [Algicella marina]QHQ35415.1 FCD domain-containing protein [Algicella marina]